MNCVRCKKECLSNELVNGYCYECRKYLGIDEENKENLKYENLENEVGHKISIVSSIIKYLGILVSIISAIACICIEEDKFVGIVLATLLCSIGIITYYFLSLLLQALAEILNLLENIKYKF